MFTVNQEGEKGHENPSARVCKWQSPRCLFQVRNKTQSCCLRRERLVRILPDSRVEAVFEGEKEAVKALVEFCKRGSSGAVVTNVDLTWEDYTGEFVGFKIKY